MYTPSKFINMQSLKDFILMVYEKKPTSKGFFRGGKMSTTSLEHMQISKIALNMHDLLNVINNYTKFQLNWIGLTVHNSFN